MVCVCGGGGGGGGGGVFVEKQILAGTCCCHKNESRQAITIKTQFMWRLMSKTFV